MKRPEIVIGLLIIVLLLSMLASLASGAVSIAPADVVQALFAWTGQSDVAATEQMIVEQIRLPRTLMGAIIGATLGLTGAAMQGLFRNPLADPGLIGVSGGAALGAALIIVLGSGLVAVLPGGLEPYLTALGAFVGGVLSTVLVYRLGRSLHGGSVANMLLAGVAITTLSGALIGLLGYLADNAMLRTLTFWNMGTLAHASYERVAMLAICCALVWWRLPRRAKALNALLLGESEAHHLGVPVERLKFELIVLTALGVAASVAAAGLIGFVGLMVPHFARLMFGPDHRRVLPASMLIGASLLLFADIAARLLLLPAELPLGILTAVIGAPFFLALLVRMRAGAGHD
ncbi:iron complex transport system permease protein [Halopseudomonas xinjiangensis]|uniref:Iron complex transport system permease protein n=1 Tax=Halopseudomonas xinjiangensis TaxID=487184 RepID=A0A1H1W6A0_9GAMM|nr:iron ABC transporter permease [Halopseudomonas xinjiangensis]SDS91996.1 iron complex transport system permease protein [Halopseudomonas xinjiangensis]